MVRLPLSSDLVLPREMLTQEAQGQFATFISLGRQNRMNGWVMPARIAELNKKAAYYCTGRNPLTRAVHE